MKILLPGGSGQIGTILARHLHAQGNEVIVLSRTPIPAPWRTLQWDGRTPGAWASELENADAVIHLSGRSVNCRYTARNRRAIIESRTVPTRLLGEVIANAKNPPRIWLNASTSTLYRHAAISDARPQDEFTGEPADLPAQRGTHEPANLPETWSFSADVGHRWEKVFRAASTPHTRKIALRTSLVMSHDPGGVFSVLSGLTRAGLGGTQGPGTQFVSWITGADYCRAIDLLLAKPEIADETKGIVNMTAPNPIPNRDFMRALRQAWHIPIGLPATRWMLEIGAVFLRTETELILKSRRVTPAVLLKAGMQFQNPTWPEAAKDLVARIRSKSS